MWEVLQEYKEEMFGCTRNADSITSHFLLPCDQIPMEEMELRFQQDPQVSFVVKAVSALTAAFRLVQLQHCEGENARAFSCLRTIYPDLHEGILANVRKLSFSSMMPEKDGEGNENTIVGATKHHFSHNGRLVANRQLLYVIDPNRGLDPVRVFLPSFSGQHLRFLSSVPVGMVFRARWTSID